VALYGPSQAGKTYTALWLATQLADRVAVIDTEHGSAAHYRDLFSFEAAPLTAPFAPETYQALIEEAAAAGFGAVVIDSLSPEWDGPGGCLALADEAARGMRSANTYVAWRTVTPRHEAFLGVINRAPCHIVATYRTKPQFEQATENGKKVIRPLGELPITREGFFYEYDVAFALDAAHRATVQKTAWPGSP
jgi:hypothetical protein